ncbi:hypothetical protein C4D60_Mb00t20050 [Musa balbisiana]|uniref:Uncharacterized protein n=1 Tax=Musa balbisiana TaxID=52838 RepID=A0A4S8I2L7_MUSBA|nr:hypothetical protein C4D60_Mb00t20050 [Musa balbisiana]
MVLPTAHDRDGANRRRPLLWLGAGPFSPETGDTLIPPITDGPHLFSFQLLQELVFPVPRGQRATYPLARGTEEDCFFEVNWIYRHVSSWSSPILLLPPFHPPTERGQHRRRVPTADLSPIEFPSGHHATTSNARDAEDEREERRFPRRASTTTASRLPLLLLRRRR